jgi:hypothetical protein
MLKEKGVPNARSWSFISMAGCMVLLACPTPFRIGRFNYLHNTHIVELIILH